MMPSPYYEKEVSEWQAITEDLIKKHPLTEQEIVTAVQEAWNEIFKSKIGGLTIGKHIHPSPQIMGYLLHELIPYKLSQLYPDKYRVGKAKTEKDIHCIKDNFFSIEVKTSSNPTKIFGNRSYAQQNIETGKKDKNGYYLTINFKKFEVSNKKNPEISKIRFGYLEHSDWKGQESETGQQASLSKNVYLYKLKLLYPKV